MAEEDKNKVAVVFDFDGTIADSFEVFLESMEAVLNRPIKLTTKEIAELREMSLKDVMKKLKVKNWQLPKLAIKGRQEISRRMEQVTVFDGMPETLNKLSVNHRLYILSTNGYENIDFILDKYKLRGNFTAIYADIGLKGKARSIKQLRKKEGLGDATCIYVGDETRDIEAAKKAGVKCIAVEWGFSNPKILRTYEPDLLASNPNDLIIAIDSLTR